MLLIRGKKLYASLPTVRIRYGVNAKDIMKLIAKDVELNIKFFAICLLFDGLSAIKLSVTKITLSLLSYIRMTTLFGMGRGLFILL